MNYQERINALQSFKTTVSSGEINDSTSSFSSDINGWSGGETAKAGYDNYVLKVKTDASKAEGKKADFLCDVEDQISSIQAKFDQEYAIHSNYMNGIYNKDADKVKERKLNYYNSLKIDSSVKAKLAQYCLN